MKRAAFIGLPLLAVVLGAAAAFRRSGVDIPLYRVQATPFVRRVTAEGNLKAAKAAPLTAPLDAPEVLKVAWIVDDGDFVRKNDVVVRFDPTDFEKELILGKEDRAIADNSINKADADASTTSLNLRRDATQADTELASAKRFKFDDAEIFSRYQRIESEVNADLAAERKKHAETVLGVRGGLARADRAILAIDDKKAALRIRNAEQGLKGIEIRAPYDGIVVLQRDWRGDVAKVGSNMWSGQVLGEMPELSSMQAEVFVLEADAAGLAIGKKATVYLDSDPSRPISGSIKQFDKLARQRLRDVPVQYFGVTIALDHTDQKLMKPGARVRAVLDLEDRARALTVPRQALFEKDGKPIVYRKEGSGFRPVRVEIATSSAGRVVITKGLNEGDDVALVDPTERRKG